MEFYREEERDHAELYRLFSSLFMEEPAEEQVLRVKEMFEMKFDNTLPEIRADFAGLFLRPDLHLSPHESLRNYLPGETPALWGRAALEVQGMYRSAGLMLDEESALIPDHLAVELLFMSYLVDNGLAGPQRQFMNEHLLLWVPEFCDEIEKHAATTFYKEVAILLKELILSDSEELGGGP